MSGAAPSSLPLMSPPSAICTSVPVKSPDEVWKIVAAMKKMAEWKPVASNDTEKVVTWSKDKSPAITVTVQAEGSLVITGGKRVKEGSQEKEPDENFFKDYFLIMLHSLKAAGERHKLEGEGGISKLVEQLRDYYEVSPFAVQGGLAQAMQEFEGGPNSLQVVLEEGTYQGFCAEQKKWQEHALAERQQQQQAMMQQPPGYSRGGPQHNGSQTLSS